MNNINRLILISSLTIFLMANSIAQIKYPVTKKVKQTDTYFGVKVEDPYRWLEDDKSEETAKWVEEQNKVTQDYLSKIPYREDIKNCLSNLWNFEKYGLPIVNEEFIIYTKNNGIQNQSPVFRGKSTSDAYDLLIDPNSLSKDGTVALGDIKLSNDGKYLAYNIARSGSDWNEIYVMKTDGEKLTDKLEWVKFSSIAWRGEGFYYSRYDQQKEDTKLSGKNEFHKIYYHQLGSKQDNDVLVYENKEFPLRNYNAYTTDNEQCLFVSQTESTSGNSLLFKKLSDEREFVELTKGFDFDYDIIGSIDEQILVLTNWDAPRYRLMKIDLNNPEQSSWKEIIPQTEDVLQSVTIAGDKLILVYMNNAKSVMTVYDSGGNYIKGIKLPEIGTVNGVSGKVHFNEAFFSFTSFTKPTCIYKLNTDELVYTPHFMTRLPMKTADFVTEQVFVTSKDGKKVPMFIVHKKGIKLDGNNPVLLYGYGGFNISLTPSFSISRMFFIENGGIYAVPNLRGGGEYGSEWHKAGTKLQKQNTFNDFIAAAEYLIKNKYTNPSKLAISGGSNGGLLVGACMTQRPDLFKVALPAVGVLDMLRYHKFTIGWAWTTDYGSSENEKEFKYIYKFSPLHTIKKGVQYPATMVTTADHDDRVVPAHSFKFISTLQENHKGNNPVLIRIDAKAGHGAGKPTSKAIEEAADVWAFTFFNLKIDYKGKCEKVKEKNTDDDGSDSGKPVEVKVAPTISPLK